MLFQKHAFPPSSDTHERCREQPWAADVRGRRPAHTYAIVEVDPGTRPVEADVVGDRRLLRLRLEVAAHLLLVVPDLVEQVALQQCPLGVVPVGRVGPLRRRDRHRARRVGEVGGVAPADHPVLPHEVELTVVVAKKRWERVYN